jgi:hypothetical protein
LCRKIVKKTTGKEGFSLMKANMVSNNATTEQKKVINLGSRQIKMIKSTCNLLDEKQNEQLHIHVNEMINLG